ncbi:MAG: hypothetical protein CMJ39_13110 [Phycisphaerae bacterium]|nr:hypothetical protein [Phycisphaerae bacterium]
MFIYAGIDEAGYGPMLGPLCVASSVFILEEPPEDGVAPDLWDDLSRVVSRNLRDAKHRITIADSKKLKGARSGQSHPLRHLERGVLACFAAMNTDSHVLDELNQNELLGSFGVQVPDRPWYSDSGLFPLAADLDKLRIDSSRLRRSMNEAGIQIESMNCSALGAGDFNRHVNKTHNKSSINIWLVFQQVEAIWSRFPDARPRIVVDRQGGRSAYRKELQIAWPEASIKIIAESAEFSRYEVNLPGRGQLVIIFTIQAESHHMPVALASMTAKYVRELMMSRLNRYFISQQPGLRETAGYVEDARRYLADIDTLLNESHIDRDELVRCC